MRLPSTEHAVPAAQNHLMEPRPMCCAHAGLDCVTCVKQSARQVAALCGHLAESQQTAVFFQLYRDPVCSVNVKRFRRHYDLLAAGPPAEEAAPAELELALA